MSKEFEVTYSVEDGYVGGDRPQFLTIDDDVFSEDDNEWELKAIFWDSIQEHFMQTVSAHSSQEAQFLAWAKERQAAMRAENEGA